MMQTYIALGSNLNNPIDQVESAIAELDQIKATHVIRKSSLYHNPPLGHLDQPDFVNAVVKAETELSAEDLLVELFKIENAHGRKREVHHGPRTLDLDILLYGDQIIASPSLQVPHPSLEERIFVMIPLVEISPELILPCGKSVKMVLEKLQRLEFSCEKI